MASFSQLKENMDSKYKLPIQNVIFCLKPGVLKIEQNYIDRLKVLCKDKSLTICDGLPDLPKIDRHLNYHSGIHV